MTSIIRASEAARKVGYTATHMMRKAKDPDDDFPSPVVLGPRSIGFVESELEEWIQARITERDEGRAKFPTKPQRKAPGDAPAS